MAGVVDLIAMDLVERAAVGDRPVRPFVEWHDIRKKVRKRSGVCGGRGREVQTVPVTRFVLMVRQNIQRTASSQYVYKWDSRSVA